MRWDLIEIGIGCNWVRICGKAIRNWKRCQQWPMENLTDFHERLAGIELIRSIVKRRQLLHVWFFSSFLGHCKVTVDKVSSSNRQQSHRPSTKALLSAGRNPIASRAIAPMHPMAFMKLVAWWAWIAAGYPAWVAERTLWMLVRTMNIYWCGKTQTSIGEEYRVKFLEPNCLNFPRCCIPVRSIRKRKSRVLATHLIQHQCW